jgi:hypothetical protein
MRPRPLRPLIVCLGLGLLLGACEGGAPDAEQPRSETYVLVDLSETWQNPTDRDRNQRVLAEVGQGIAVVAETVEPPIAVQYRVIGQGSLGREPICDVLYRPSLIAIREERPDYLITKASKLKSYLGVDCPALIVRQPPEKLTEISATIASVATLPPRPGVKRFLIIASDFREETRGAPAPLPDLKQYRVLLIYRALRDDQIQPADLDDRVEHWRALLSDKGATVTTTPDTALKRATVAAFLTRR